MSNKVIGIISYLPNNINIRTNRLKKLKKLLTSCDKLFNLPIILVAQNYNNLELKDLSEHSNLIINSYPKLGIVGARNELRKIFLSLDFDYLIMLDDDCTLLGDNGNNYIKQIDDNPGCFYEFNKSLLKLFAIHRDLFKELEFDTSLDPEKGQGFEDRLFVYTLRKKYPNKKYEFKNTGIQEISISTADPNTTWYDNQNLKQMLDNTYAKLNGI